MTNSSIDYTIATEGHGANTKITENMHMGLGGVDAGQTTKKGLFSGEQSSHVGVYGLFSISDSKASAFTHSGYQQSESHSETIFGATLASSSSTNIGSGGLNHSEHYNFFGKKVGFNFHIPAVPNLGIIDGLKGIHMPHIDFSGLRHLPDINLGVIGDAVHRLVELGHDSHIVEVGGHVIKFVKDGGKLVLEVVEVVAEVAKVLG